MRPIWTLARKEFRLLLRDPRAGVLLLGMPLLFILILGLLLGEGFGQTPDQRLRVSLVDLDQGYGVEEAVSWLARTPPAGPLPSAVDPQAVAALGLAAAHRVGRFPPGGRWSQVVLSDLEETGGIRVEMIPSREEAERLCREGKRAAVLVFGPNFSRRVARCSFLADGINPFFRDGVKMEEVGAELVRDPTQMTTASVIEQVAEVSLLRVVLPWMIGKAFEKISERDFIERLGNEVRLPVPAGDNLLERRIIEAKFKAKGVTVVDGKVSLNEALKVAAPDRATEDDYRRRVGRGVQRALSQQFRKYDLTGKTWATLTRSEPHSGAGAGATTYQDEDGSGLLKRGAARYQILVPSYTVMFAFALVLVVGWLFVSERRRGTLKRLQAAPVTRSEVLLGKFLPCLALAVAQGVFLLVAGKLLFGLRWGPEAWPVGRQLVWLLPVAAATALAAMGLALLVAAAARTEMQVAIYGSVLVLALGLVSGCVVPREWMPEQAQQVSLVTPHAWALDAYRQLLLSPAPNLAMVVKSCLVLGGFGAGFLALAWWFLKLE
jgi:ABC-type multidrug transport system permease subunit